MFIRDIRRSGRWFPKRGCIWSIRSSGFGKMILRDSCSTSYDLASLFRGRRNTLDRWSGKIPKLPKRIGTRPSGSALNFPFLKEVSQNCFVFDVLNFENWGSLAELLRFWCCHLSTIEEVSQNCFVFGAAKFKHWGNLAELLRVRCCCEVKTLRKSCRLAALSMLSSLDSEQVLQVVLWS